MVFSLGAKEIVVGLDYSYLDAGVFYFTWDTENTYILQDISNVMYICKGWTWTLSSDIFPPGTPLKISDNTVFTPIMEAVTVTLTYDLGYEGSTPVVKEVELYSDSAFFKPEREHYSFDLWVADDGNTYRDFHSFFASEKRNRTFVAKWNKNPIITFDYGYEGGPDAYSIEIEYGGGFELPEKPQRIGYSFRGWNYDKRSGVTKDETVTASWSPNLVSIDFYDMEGDKGHTYKQCYSNESTTCPLSPRKDRPGYEFLGWMLDGKLYKPGDAITSLTNVSLYGQWEYVYDKQVKSANDNVAKNKPVQTESLLKYLASNEPSAQSYQLNSNGTKISIKTYVDGGNKSINLVTSGYYGTTNMTFIITADFEAYLDNYEHAVIYLNDIPKEEKESIFDMFQIVNSLIDAIDLTKFIGSGIYEDKPNKKVYYYEDFADGDFTLRMYYLNNVWTYLEEGNVVLSISLSDEVPDDAFSVPSYYQELGFSSLL